MGRPVVTRGSATLGTAAGLGQSSLTGPCRPVCRDRLRSPHGGDRAGLCVGVRSSLPGRPGRWLSLQREVLREQTHTNTERPLDISHVPRTLPGRAWTGSWAAPLY